MATANLEDLSKSLELSLNENSPEECIRKTLRAHGFFNHMYAAKINGKGSKTKMNKHTVCGISEEDKKRTTQLVSHFKEGKEFHTLKEPHHLYGSPRSRKLQQQQLPFWPSEVECIRERPTLLMIPPRYSEPYYIPCREVVSPKIRSGDGHGTVVYTNLPGPEKYFVKSRGGPSLSLPPAQTPSSTDTSLQFESRFESGNLCKAVQVGKWDYELYLRYDLYTKKHTQWFYFRVRNMRAGQMYRFTIVNLYKAGSLYNEGMQPVFYSEKEAREQGLGWHRAGHNIKYFKTSLRRLDTKQEAFCYGVTWSHIFKHCGDTCFFAHTYPYTYSDLQDYLQKILNNREKAKFCKYRVLCHSIAGNPVPLLTITSPSLTPDDSQSKRGIVVTARIHPGETNGSWMMKGLLDFLTSSADDTKILRDLFVFKIIPMLNPDGVIVGNYRCSLSGRDLNRNYRSKLKDSYPTVWHTRHMVKRFCQEREVILFCDLHGHSRKHNIFIYGCDTMDDPASRLRSRVFPRMLSKNAPDKFSYNSSRFVVQKSKESTGRVVMWREAGIQNSYTLEATFSGSTQGKLKGIQFSTRQLEEMGCHLCDTLLDFCDPDQSKTEKIMQELEDDYRKSVLAALASLGQELPPGVDPLDIQLDPVLAEADSSDVGSDSSESDGLPVHLQWKQRKTKKKKKLKTRKERNKQKALLKMNHHRVYSIPTSSIPHPVLFTESQGSEKAKNEDKGERKRETTTQQSYDILSSHALTHNGGIPMFVQERLEERQKRREEDNSSDALVGIPSEQLRLALLHVQVTHTQQAMSSTIFLPYPSCPMNISQVHMHNVSRTQKMNSKVSLPRLDTGSLGPPELPALPLHSSMSKGAFTTQYVAHHLQHIVADPSGSRITETGINTSQNKTQNLSNLSRLFRQFRPQILHDQQHLKPTPQSVYHRKGARERHEQSERSQYRNGTVTATLETANKPGCIPVVNGKEGDPRKKQCSLSQHIYSNTAPNVKVPVVARTVNYTQSSSGNLTKGSGSRCSSPMTSSWESFSKGVTLKDRQLGKVEGRERKEWEQEEKRLGDKIELGRLGMKRNKMSGSNITEAHSVAMGVQLPERETYHYLVKKEESKEFLSERHTPAQPPALTCDTPEIVDLSPDKNAAVKTHKRGIANAIETVHAKRQNVLQPHNSSLYDYSIPHIPTSKSDPLPSSKLLSLLPKNHKHKSQHLLTTESEFAKSVIKQDECRGKGRRTRAEKVQREWDKRTLQHKQHVHDEISTRASRPDKVHQNPFQHSHTTDEGELLLHRIYSSKPPSHYGPRPGPDDGVPPATVSLMLNGRQKCIPTTTYSSRRSGKRAHIHYFTRRT